jgi:hypothetical protein
VRPAALNEDDGDAAETSIQTDKEAVLRTHWRCAMSDSGDQPRLERSRARARSSHSGHLGSGFPATDRGRPATTICNFSGYILSANPAQRFHAVGGMRHRSEANHVEPCHHADGHEVGFAGMIGGDHTAMLMISHEGVDRCEVLDALIIDGLLSC